MSDSSILQPSSPAPSPLRFAQHALVYGGIAGAVGGGWMILEYALGLHTEHANVGRWTAIAAMIVPIGAVVFGVTSWRNHALAGRIRFVQAFGMALAIELAYALCLAFAAWIHSAWIDPNLISTVLDGIGRTAAQQPGANADEIARQAEQWKAATTPYTYAQGVFARSLFLGFFVGLLAAVTVPKKRPGLE